MEANKNKRKPILQWLLAVMAVFLLGFVGIVSNINTVFGAALSGITVDGLNASYDKGDWSTAGNEITGSIAASSSSGCSGTSYSAQTANLTLSNGKGEEAKLSFTYSFTANSGSLTVDGGTAITSNVSNQSFSKTLAANATVVISVKSNSSNTNASTVVLSGLSLVVEKNVKGTFYNGDHGTYTVNGTTATNGYEVSQLSTQAFTVVATAASGYQFYAWHINTSNTNLDDPSTIESRNATFSILKDQDFYVKPEFVKKNTAVFLVGSTYYNDLNDANDAAKARPSGEKNIYLTGNGTIFQGNYTIDNGVLLLIPYDSTNTIVRETPEVVDYAAASAFMTLTIDQDVNITVNGEISVAGKISKTMPNNGRTAGKCGMIKFVDNSNSVITLTSTGKLYCWGYIYGNSGLINAQSSSKVYEPFQLAGWRGGNATTDMIGNNYDVFPANQYFVQNIEVETRFYAGSTETVFTAVSVTVLISQVTRTASVVFIGSNSGMFKITSGYVSKRYDVATDTLVVEVNGKVNIESINISISGYEMNSNDYVLPITNSIKIIIKSGESSTNQNTVTTNQDLAFLPGSKMIIEQNAKLIVDNNNSVYVYDSDNWGNYVYNNGNKTYSNVLYSPNPLRHTKTAQEAVIDAEIDICGTVSVASGAGLYTTTNGANVHSSSKTGKITFVSGPGNKTKTYQAIQGGSKGNAVNNQIYNPSDENPSGYVEISVTNAKLRNGSAYIGTSDEFYETTSVEPGYDVCYNATVDKWDEDDGGDDTYTITFHDPITNSSFTRTYTEGQPFDMPTHSDAASAGFAYGDYTIKKWKYGTTRVYIVGQTNVTDMVSDDITFEAFWGGWEIDGTNYTYLRYDTGTNAKGLWRIDSRDEMVVQREGGFTVSGSSLCLFDSNTGFLITSINDGQTTKWLYSESSSDYYIDKGVVAEGLGLVQFDNYLIYVLNDGTIVKNSTFYVAPDKINNYVVNGHDVNDGLYYFDSNGHMWYGNDLIDDNHEFGEISSGITQGGGN